MEVTRRKKKDVSKTSKTLTDKQYQDLLNLREMFPTDVACGLAIGIDRGTLLRVLYIKSGSHTTINLILKAIENYL
jgi:hypothetical protein